MQDVFRPRWWAAALVLIVGCRGSQVAYHFPVPARVAATAVTAESKPAPATPAVLPAPTRRLPDVPKPRGPVTAATPRSLANPGGPFGQHRPLARPFRVALVRRPETAARPTRATTGRDTRHLVLGFALVAAGVVAGLLLGGWLGLGVGAVVVILGYYFVVLGLGGKHAWLEIFQEFFNM